MAVADLNDDDDDDGLKAYNLIQSELGQWGSTTPRRRYSPGTGGGHYSSQYYYDDDLSPPTPRAAAATVRGGGPREAGQTATSSFAGAVPSGSVSFHIAGTCVSHIISF